MAQGLEYTTEQKNTIVNSLREYLELGFSRNKSCMLIGLAPQTLSNWIKADESLGMRIEGYENAINKVAMANIEQAIRKEGEIEDPRKETSKWWLERKMRGDFATRQEQTGADGAPIALEVTKKEEIEKALDDL